MLSLRTLITYKQGHKNIACILEQYLNMSFSDKVVLVTGAGSGIGAAAAILFSKHGATVVLVGRNQVKLNTVTQQCAQNGRRLVIKADITKDAGAIINKTIEEFGKLDVLVNNAGISKAGSLLQGDMIDAYDTVMQTNVRAVICLTTLATPFLVKTKGNIINVSSAFSQLVPKASQQATYCISKCALDHFTRCAAAELAPLGVRVNSINPGPVKTDFISNMGLADPDIIWELYRQNTALKRLGDPKEIADLMLFLASDKAKSITGSIIVSDNGYLLRN